MLRQNPAYRPRNLPLFRAVRSGALALILGVPLACAHQVPVQVMSPAPAPSTPAPPPTPASWSFRPTSAAQSFIEEQVAQLVLRADTATRIDSVSSRIGLSFASQPPAGGVRGSVTAFSVRSGGNEATPVGVVLPFAFAASYTAPGRQLSVTLPADLGGCGSAQLPVVHAVRDLWYRPPDSLRVGTSWADSGSYVVCRDGIPLEFSVFRTFRVAAAAERDGHTELTVTRTARLSVRAEARKGDDTTRVSGTGAGDLTYTIDPGAGTLLGATGTSQLDLFVRARSRAYSVRQTSSIRIAPAIPR